MATATAVRTPLNRDKVVERVLEIADHEGLEAITIRRLAGEFEVTPMALYWHFKTKDDLLNAAVDRVVADLPPADPSALTWSERFADAFTRLVTALRRHPQLATLVPPQFLQTAAGRNLTEVALAALVDGGFDVPRAAQIGGQALLTAITLVTADAVDESGVDPAEFDEQLRQKRAMLAALPPDRYPHLIAAADDLIQCSETDLFFEFGTELFIAGVTALAPQG